MRGQFWAWFCGGLVYIPSLLWNSGSSPISWPAGWWETIGPIASPAPTDGQESSLADRKLTMDAEIIRDQKYHQLNPDKIIDLRNDLKNSLSFDVFYYADRGDWYCWCLRVSEKQWMIFLLCLYLYVYFPLSKIQVSEERAFPPLRFNYVTISSA